MPRILGGSVDSGGSLSGIVTSSDATGGGLIAVDFTDIQITNADQAQLRYFNRLAVSLAGGVRQCIVPFPTDWTQPIAASDPSPASVVGVVFGAQAQGAATITISLINGTGVLQGGEWFGLNHPTRGQRAYCVTDPDTVTTDGSGHPLITFGFRPPLRDTIADGSAVLWYRPQCLMRLAPGFSADVDVSEYWLATPQLKFIEAF